MEEKALVHLTLGLSLDTLTSHENRDGSQFTQHGSQELSFEGSRVGGEWENAGNLTLNENKGGIKRSNSTSALKALPDKKKAFTGDCGGSIISEFYSPESHRSADHAVKKVSDIILRGEGLTVQAEVSGVIGAYFEKLGSNSFAVYSIAVTDSENRTWFVKRRYRNFERLHKHLKEIPNYTLHLPPKKDILDLLSIANVAEQHEVWDFLSASSKAWILWNCNLLLSFFVEHVVALFLLMLHMSSHENWQFKEVSDGFMRKVVGSTSHLMKLILQSTARTCLHSDDTANSFSDTEKVLESDTGVGSTAKANGWHSDNELNAKDFPPRVIKWGDESQTLENSAVGSSHLDDPVGMPPEWTPSNVSLPLLNLVDKVTVNVTTVTVALELTRQQCPALLPLPTLFPRRRREKWVQKSSPNHYRLSSNHEFPSNVNQSRGKIENTPGIEARFEAH
uniref:PX domain-containing protein n=1 Tax=Salix viminalis TaxID=40686 RepID=A0A6N2MBQ2_SALVM